MAAAAVVTVALSSSVQSARAMQDAIASSEVKAAFLYNFAKLAEWPADALPPGDALTVCSNDTAVANALSQLPKGRALNGHRLDVRRVSADSVQLHGCHLLYIWNLNTSQARQLVESLKGTAVLTVSDINGFAALGGVVQLITQADRIRFAINVDAMRRQRLRLSPTVLALATIVKDE